MAEAVVEQPSHQSNRFYCHSCSQEIERITDDFKCPQCSNGFIEELLEPQQTQPTRRSTASADLQLPQDLGLELSQILMDVAAATNEDYDQLGFSTNVNDSATPRTSTSTTVHLNHNHPLPLRRNRGLIQIPNNMRRNNNYELLNDFLIALTGSVDTTAATLTNALGNVQQLNQMYVLGNPADYAWGREGLDTIVTQLLNQMDCTGPPPLSKEKIETIPSVPVSEEHVKSNQSCSTCWEDFQLNEMVRQLPCMHIYHESCIIPWLELHSTCPICRKTLLSSDEAAAAQQSAQSQFARTVIDLTDDEPNSSIARHHNRGINQDITLMEYEDEFMDLE